MVFSSNEIYLIRLIINYIDLEKGEDSFQAINNFMNESNSDLDM